MKNIVVASIILGGSIIFATFLYVNKKTEFELCMERSKFVLYGEQGTITALAICAGVDK